MPIEINAVKPDRSRIDLEVDAGVRHWMKTLHATREQIEAAIEKVGADADTVRKELARRRLDKSENSES